MGFFRKPKIKVHSNGSWEVDLEQLLASEKIKDDLKKIDELYRRLRENGDAVQCVDRTS